MERHHGERQWHRPDTRGTSEARNRSGTTDWLLLIDPANAPITGTNGNNTLKATAEGDVVFGLKGNDVLSSTFNRTALIGGEGRDTLTTDAVVSVGESGPVHGLAVQIGGKGDDSLDATIALQQDASTGQDRSATAENWLDGGPGNDVIKAAAKVLKVSSGDIALTNHILGGSGNDTIDAVADGRGNLGQQQLMNSIAGGSGNDHITALAQTDFVAASGTAINIVDGGDGNDVIDATAIGTSNDTPLVKNSLHGGRGNDTVHAVNVSDSNSMIAVAVNELWGDEGNDTLEATHTTDGENVVTDLTTSLDGGAGDDHLKADTTALGVHVQAVNNLKGGADNDVLTATIDSWAIGGRLDKDAYHLSNHLNGGTGRTGSMLRCR